MSNSSVVLASGNRSRMKRSSKSTSDHKKQSINKESPKIGAHSQKSNKRTGAGHRSAKE